MGRSREGRIFPHSIMAPKHGSKAGTSSAPTLSHRGFALLLWVQDMPGMPGMNMYSRDDLAGMMDGAYDADDEDYGDYDGMYGGGDEGGEQPEPGFGACSLFGTHTTGLRRMN